MRDHFLDQLGGGHFAREDSDAKTPADQSIRSRLFGEQRVQVVEDQQGRHTNDNVLFDADESRPPGVARLKTWPWVVAGVGLALAALVWAGFSYRPGGRTSAA